jgi:hypothetical protein
MDPALRVAGFALAHAVASIRFGGTLCTLAVIERGSHRSLVRFEAPSIPDSLAVAHAHLAGEVGDGAFAALVYDGYVTADEQERADALVAEIIGSHGVPLGRLAQRYVPARRFGLPVIGRRCIPLDAPVIDESIDPGAAAAMVYAGVREHPFGARLFHLPEA